MTAYFGIKLGFQGDSKRYTFIEMEIGVSGYFGMKCGLQGGESVRFGPEALRLEGLHILV